MTNASWPDDGAVIRREVLGGGVREVRVEVVRGLPGGVAAVTVRTPEVLGILVNRQFVRRGWAIPLFGVLFVTLAIAEFAADLYRDGALELVQIFR